MNETIIALIGWASLLSGYPTPDHPIAVEYREHQFFVDTICGGVECNVIGGYLDGDAPNTLFIDERFEHETSLYAYSFIVHEAIHSLQWRTGLYETNNCEHSLIRERQAYHLQNEFLIANGHAPIMRMVNGVCAKEAT